MPPAVRTASSRKRDSVPPNPTPDLRVLLRGLEAVRDGDFSVRLPSDWTGLDGKIADRFNEIVSLNQDMASEIARVGQVVGKRRARPASASASRAPAARGARCRSRSTR